MFSCVGSSEHSVAWRPLESDWMTGTKKESNGTHGYVAPVAWIMVLLAGYWLIAEWKSLPALIHSAIAMIH